MYTMFPGELIHTLHPLSYSLFHLGMFIIIRHASCVRILVCVNRLYREIALVIRDQSYDFQDILLSCVMLA